jgi:hypothetical protein
VSTALFNLFGGAALVLWFTTDSVGAHVVAGICSFCAVYIVLSFFAPLWLPSLRDKRSIARQRALVEEIVKRRVELEQAKRSKNVE